MVGLRRSLTEEEERIIWDTICSKMQSDDREPDEVIQQDFGGDRRAYLIVMADWLGIKIKDN